MDRRRLGEILVGEAIVSADTVERALALQPTNPRRRLGQLLVDTGALDPGWLTAALAQQAGCETVDPLALPVDPARLWLVPPDVAERLGAFVATDAEGPIAVLADPTAAASVRALEGLLGVPNLRFAAGLPERVSAAIALHYDASRPRDRRLLGIVGEQRPVTAAITSAALDQRRMLARLTRATDRSHHDFAVALVVFAIESGAERLQLHEGAVSVTWDGVEQQVLRLGGPHAVQIAARLKALARKDPDGGGPNDVELPLGDHLIAARCFGRAGPIGGSVDVRFAPPIGAEDLRPAPQVAAAWQQLLGRPGLVLLVSGDDAGPDSVIPLPAGTKCFDLADAEAVGRAVAAVEAGAPVVGRIRGASTAQGVARLRSLASAPLAVAAALTGVMLTARVRRVCATCCWPGEVDAQAGEQLGVVPFAAPIAGVGCPACAYRKHAGSFVCFELAVADDALRAAMCRGASTPSLGELLRPVADRTLHVDAVAHAIAGEATVEELTRALPPRPAWADRPAGERHRGLFRAVTDPGAADPPMAGSDEEDELPVVVLIAPGEGAAGSLRASVRGRADVVGFPSATAALACTQPLQPAIGILAQWASGGWQTELIREWKSMGTKVVLLGPTGDLGQMEQAFALGADDYAGSIEELGVRLTRWLPAVAAGRQATG